MSEPNYRCPVCGTLSTMIIGETQAFCTNLEEGDQKCNVISFNPSLPDGGLSEMKFINLDDLDPKSR